MKLKITLLSALLSSALGFSQAEFVNSNFGNNGVTCIDIAGQTIKMADIVKVNDNYYGLTNFVNSNLIKLSFDGNIVLSFGTNGHIPLNIGPTGGSIYDKDSHILVTPDNELILVTNHDNSPFGTSFMTRMDLEGNTITSFGNNGFVPYFGSDYIYFLSAEIVDNELILVGAGANTTNPNNTQRYIIVMKYDLDGHLVTSFGNNGILTAPTDSHSFPNAAHYFPETNKVAITADHYYNFEYYALAAMYDMGSGTADPNFGTNGYINFYPSNGITTYLSAMYCDSNNIYLSGWIDAGSSQAHLFLQKLNLNGQPSPTFGNSNGTFQQIMQGTTSLLVSSIASTNGNLLLTGSVNTVDSDFDKIFLMKMGQNGIPDNSFGNNGMIINPMELAYIGTGYKTIIDDNIITVATLSLSCSSDDQPKPAVVQFITGEMSNNEHHQPTIGHYPNPVKDILNFTEPIDNAEVYDVTGKLVLATNAASEHINLSKLQNGLYMIRVSQNGTISNIKIIKE